MKKALALGLGVAALSKMGGAGTAAANVDSGRGGKTASAIARTKANVKPSMPDRNRGTKSIGTSSSVRTVEPKGNPKSIYVMDDGSIQKGDKLYKDKKSFANRDKTKGSSGLKDFANKFILGPKAQLNKGGNVQGKMIKARGGGMARTKPTKMY